MKARTSTQTLMMARMLPTRAVGLGVAAVGVLLVGLAQSADAGTKLRPARDISGVWGDAAFSFTYDPSLKPGERRRWSCSRSTRRATWPERRRLPRPRRRASR